MGSSDGVLGDDGGCLLLYCMPGCCAYGYSQQENVTLFARSGLKSSEAPRGIGRNRRARRIAGGEARDRERWAAEGSGEKKGDGIAAVALTCNVLTKFRTKFSNQRMVFHARQIELGGLLTRVSRRQIPAIAQTEPSLFASRHEDEKLRAAALQRMAHRLIPRAEARTYNLPRLTLIDVAANFKGSCPLLCDTATPSTPA